MNAAAHAAGDANVLITGVTSFLGKATLARLVDKVNIDRIYLLLPTDDHESDSTPLDLLLRQMFPLWRANELRRRVIGLTGDFTQSGCGLSPESLGICREHVDQILHCGANTDLDASLEKSRRFNTEGTLHVLQLAEELYRHGRLRRLDYVSTAYVCGRKPGVTTETDLERGQTFSNYFEQSKFEAETLVRQYASRFPICIYRPSIVVGHSYNGYTPNFKVLYWPILLLAKDMLPFLVCNPQAFLDIVPVDYVADSIVALMSSEDALGETFLLTAGLGREIRIRDILHDAYEIAGLKRRPIIPFWLFEMLARTPVARLLPMQFWALIEAAKPYFPYLRGSTSRFDSKKSLAVLAEIGITPPNWQDYKQEILNFCVATRWGKRLPLPEYSYYLPAKLMRAV
jgi:thioester reductase-like protein